MIWGWILLQLVGFCAVRKWVVPRQQFKTNLCSCCTKRAPDQERFWCSGLFATCCPCFQWFRVIAFIYECPRTTCGKCCSAFGCLLFTGCCLVNPFGLGCFVATSCLFGNCKSACTRYVLPAHRFRQTRLRFHMRILRFGLRLVHVLLNCVYHEMVGRSRYKIRQRLNIKGKLWEDCLIHCFVGLVRTNAPHSHIILLYNNYVGSYRFS